MHYKNDKKISNLSSPDSFFQAQKAPKSVFGWGPAPDPAGWAYDAPPGPRPQLAGEGDTPSPFPSPLDAEGVSNSAPRFSGPPQHKILATPV